MKWLHDQGLVSSYHDYLGLPGPVLEHARMLMEAEWAEARKVARA